MEHRRFYTEPETPAQPVLEMPPALMAVLDQIAQGMAVLGTQQFRVEELLAAALERPMPEPRVDVRVPDVVVPPTTVALPDVLRVVLDEAVDLTPGTIKELRDAVKAMQSSAQAATRVVSSGGGFSGSKLPNLTGTWGYAAGTSGTVALDGRKRVLTVTASSVAGGTVTVDGGDPITIPANGEMTIEPQVQLTDPTIVFTGTDAYYVDWLTG